MTLCNHKKNNRFLGRTLFVGLMLLSCEDVVDVALPANENRLVIDANFRFFLFEEPIEAQGGVQLSLTTSFFNQEIPKVNGATVFITDLNNGTVFEFTEVDDTGFYIPLSTDLLPSRNSEYELSVIYNGDTYIGRAELVPTVRIDAVEKGDGVLFTGDEQELRISFTDDGTRNDFYLFDLDFNQFLLSDDTFYQGQKFTFSYFYTNLDSGDIVEIQIIGVDKPFARYTEQLLELSGQDSGGPFTVTPSTPRGNIINVTDPENYPLGYFSLSETYRTSFVFLE